MTGVRLDQVMDVFTEDPTTGAFTVLNQAAVPCHLFHVARQPAATAADRAELAALRNLHYSASYTLPNGAQILSGGVRWNTLHGTDGVIQPFGVVIQKRIDLVRAD